MGLIFHDKNKKGIQINALVCTNSNRTNKSTSALIRVLRVEELQTHLNSSSPFLSIFSFTIKSPASTLASSYFLSVALASSYFKEGI